eukprot:scaffold23270_cov65-Phaeocystis_antarctica.AAC.4
MRLHHEAEGEAEGTAQPAPRDGDEGLPGRAVAHAAQRGVKAEDDDEAHDEQHEPCEYGVEEVDVGDVGAHELEADDEANELEEQCVEEPLDHVPHHAQLHRVGDQRPEGEGEHRTHGDEGEDARGAR